MDPARPPRPTKWRRSTGPHFAPAVAMHATTALLCVLAVIGCSRKILPYQTEIKDEMAAKPPGKKPAMVYVTDFEVDDPTTPPADAELRPPGPLGRVLDRVRDQEDPLQRAAELVDLMSRTLVADLNKDGVPAERLQAGSPEPAAGWIVRGVVTDVDQGNRLKRAVVGFGAGESQVQLVVNVADLSEKPVQPFYTFDAGSTSGEMPGAAITLNPYAAAAKFVLSRNATEVEVTRTAGKIAEQIVAKVNAAE